VVNGDITLHDKLISMYHDSFVSRHSGAIVTVKKMRSLFYCKKQQKPSLILDWVGRICLNSIVKRSFL